MVSKERRWLGNVEGNLLMNCGLYCRGVEWSGAGAGAGAGKKKALME
jgi:hypothetical protein